MASRYSLTIQLANPSISGKSPGHVAVVINTPDGQTYAGFGPASHDWRSLGGAWASPSFKPQTVPPGTVPPDASNPLNYSTASGHNSYATFTIPISEAQAEAANAEIKRIKQAAPDYILGYEMCATITNQIMQAAGIGSHLFANPSKNFQSLTEIAKTLALDPNAQFTRDGLFIPEAFRGLQQDYAYVGGGHDTPSERTGRVPSRPQDSGSQMLEFGTNAPATSGPQDSFGDRFGKWGSVPASVAQPPASDRPESFDMRFGNWSSVPAGAFGDGGSPVLRALENYRRSAVPDGPASAPGWPAPPATRAFQPDVVGAGGGLGKFSSFADGSENASDAPGPFSYPRLRRVVPDGTPLDLDQPAAPPERAPVPGIFGGKLMSELRLPPSVWGLPDNSESSGKIDLVNLLVRPDFRSPTPAVQPPDAVRPERSLGRRIVGQPEALVFDAGAPAVPFIPNSALLAPDRKDAFGTGEGAFSPMLPSPPSDGSIASILMDSIRERARPPEYASTVFRWRDGSAVRFA